MKRNHSMTKHHVFLTEGNKQFYKRYKNATFDLIIADVAGPECFLKYAQVFGNPPIISYTAFFSRHAMFLSDSENPAYIPHFMSTLTDSKYQITLGLNLTTLKLSTITFGCSFCLVEDKLKVHPSKEPRLCKLREAILGDEWKKNQTF